MRTPQFAGLGVTAAVVLGVDLPIDWLVLLAMTCGGLATFVFKLRQG
jgi:hypothetical protein